MPPEHARLLAGRRLLILDQSDLLGDDLGMALEEMGVEIVGPAPDVDAALRLLRRDERVSGAILDLNVEGEAVFPLADALLARQVPFVFAAAREQPAIMRRHPGFVLCRKPVRLAEIAVALFGDRRRLM